MSIVTKLPNVSAQSRAFISGRSKSTWHGDLYTQTGAGGYNIYNNIASIFSSVMLFAAVVAALLVSLLWSMECIIQVEDGLPSAIVAFQGTI